MYIWFKKLDLQTHSPNDIFLFLTHLHHDRACKCFHRQVRLLSSRELLWFYKKYLLEPSRFIFCFTYFGSQWAILKSKLILVTNISHSSRISWTEGGGRAIAIPTMPSSGGWDFLFWLNEYWGRRRHSMRTTCNKVMSVERKSLDQALV